MNDRVTTLPSADYGYGISQEQWPRASPSRCAAAWA